MLAHTYPLPEHPHTPTDSSTTSSLRLCPHSEQHPHRVLVHIPSHPISLRGLLTSIPLSQKGPNLPPPGLIHINPFPPTSPVNLHTHTLPPPFQEPHTHLSRLRAGLSLGPLGSVIIPPTSVPGPSRLQSAESQSLRAGRDESWRPKSKGMESLLKGVSSLFLSSALLRLSFVLTGFYLQSLPPLGLQTNQPINEQSQAVTSLKSC